MNSFSEQLRIEKINDKELIDIKDKINKTIDEKKTKIKTFENRLLMNKTISFVEEDSEQLGHLIVNHKFDRFEVTEESGKLIMTFKGLKDRDWVNCIQQIEDFSKIIICSFELAIACNPAMIAVSSDNCV